ncbi:hypothetical protein MTO96_039080, partial [Rhipicephalus appendiculatus]
MEECNVISDYNIASSACVVAKYSWFLAANDSVASVAPSPVYDWRIVVHRLIIDEKTRNATCPFQKFAGPIRGILPGDDDMYQMLVGDAPVQHYTVVMSPVTQLSSTKTIGSSYKHCEGRYRGLEPLGVVLLDRDLGHRRLHDNAVRLRLARNYVTSSTLVWCFLIVLTGIISFTTTLFILTLI